MREIKFRFWNRKTKQMASWDDMENGTSSRLCSEFEDIRNEENEIMQYTGLKDKNGKEIYEGDIVRHLPTAFNSSSGVGEIYYHKGHARFALKWVGNLEHYLDSLNSYEIIGNVYENPDLLSTQPSQE